jgi:hypothetical protein
MSVPPTYKAARIGPSPESCRRPAGNVELLEGQGAKPDAEAALHFQGAGTHHNVFTEFCVGATAAASGQRRTLARAWRPGPRLQTGLKFRWQRDPLSDERHDRDGDAKIIAQHPAEVRGVPMRLGEVAAEMPQRLIINFSPAHGRGTHRVAIAQ